MNAKEIFDTNGALYIKDIISKEMAYFFTHVLMKEAHKAKIFNISGDEQVPTAAATLSHDYMFETLLEKCWGALENVLEEELIPTYAYSRLYNNGDELKKHSDREACEISVTIQLGRSHHYSWPIYMGGKRFDLNEGDGVIYKGCEIEHWRNICDGPEGYLSGQVFLHYVKKNGRFANHAGDILRNRLEYQKKEFPFIKNRQYIIEAK